MDIPVSDFKDELPALAKFSSKGWLGKFRIWDNLNIHLTTPATDSHRNECCKIEIVVPGQKKKMTVKAGAVKFHSWWLQLGLQSLIIGVRKILSSWDNWVGNRKDRYFPSFRKLFCWTFWLWKSKLGLVLEWEG